jgi:diguanylate cyclase (GGDEF)-like protein
MNIVHEKRLMQILNDKLNTLYMEDAMTGLYNRYGYAMKAVDIFRRNQAAGDATMVMFLDLNRLKHINDTFGHEHGDLAIRTVAAAIRETTPKEFIPIRYGGDEFVIIGRCNDPAEAESLKQKLLSYLQEYNQKSVNHYDVTAAIGYIIAQPDASAPLDDYVRQADAIMYQAKERFRKEAAAQNQ